VAGLRSQARGGWCVRCGVKETVFTLEKILEGDFRGDLAGDLAGVLRALEGERGRLMGDSDWCDDDGSRAERGVVAGCGAPGEGGGRHGVSELVAMLMLILMNRVLCGGTRISTWTRR